MNFGKLIRLMLFTLALAAFSNTSYGQSSRQWDVGLGGGTIETFHLSGHYQLYPSGRIGASIGLVRSFNQGLIRPFYGSGKVHFTTFSLEHSYFFKTKTRKVTPFRNE